MAILLQVLLACVGCALVWWGSTALERASEELAVYYGLPPIIQGTIIAAIGSSFPELATVVISTLRHGSFELGVSAIVGSAIFNILVIPAVSSLASDEPLESGPEVVYKESLFYMLAISVLMLTFTFGVLYEPADTGALHGRLTRVLALIPLSLYGLYLFVQYQDAHDYVPEVEAEDIQVWREWGRLAFSLALILAGVEALVHACLELGRILNVPNFFWGVTVVAAGTSLPDTLVSARAARVGNSATSLGNVFGSNTFDLLVALPVGVLIAGEAVFDLGIAAPMMGALTLCTIILFTALRTHMRLSRPEAVLLAVLYAAFVIWMGLIGFGVLPSLAT